MKYMLIMRSPVEYEVPEDFDFTEMINAMGAYNEALIKAGVFIDADGLTDANEGFVVDFDSTPPVVTDGPYAEAKELFSGFWIIETSTKEEAAEWAKRCPLGPGDQLEVRGVVDTSQFDQSNEYIQREQERREQLGS